VRFSLRPSAARINQEIGYKCLRVSSTEVKGIRKLKENLMIDQEYVLGHSGVWRKSAQ
jgi:ribosome biogenesis GTPase